MGLAEIVHLVGGRWTHGCYTRMNAPDTEIRGTASQVDTLSHVLDVDIRPSSNADADATLPKTETKRVANIDLPSCDGVDKAGDSRVERRTTERSVSSKCLKSLARTSIVHHQDGQRDYSERLEMLGGFLSYGERAKRSTSHADGAAIDALAELVEEMCHNSAEGQQQPRWPRVAARRQALRDAANALTSSPRFRRALGGTVIMSCALMLDPLASRVHATRQTDTTSKILLTLDILCSLVFVVEVVARFASILIFIA